MNAPITSPTSSPTAAPMFAMFFVVEPDRTKSPTSSPSVAPMGDTLLNALRVISEDRLDDVSSPQYQAFEWMK